MMKKLISLIAFGVTLISGARAQLLVLPGDHPDPSIVRINDEYWATATTSNWLPVFPLMSSTDLVHWKMRGNVFTKPPAWADYYFWAPEITYDNGKVWIYYSAHKKNGNLCVAAASADRPEGPYTDHGPLVCQEAGSIDAFATRDEHGKLFLVWKEDGNSVGKPTPIWAREMKEDRSGFIGEPIELFRNELPWEQNLVEGVSMIRHGDYFYAFYAAAGCCGSGCNYVMGVARSKTLSGKWEKMPIPLFTGNDQWKCPGHGTAVVQDGKFFLLYHAYDRRGGVYTGREGLLSEFRFTDDNWISLVSDSNTSSPIKDFRDDFNGKVLSEGWQWSVFDEPILSINAGALRLAPRAGKLTTFIGQKLLFSDYEVNTSVRTLTSLQAGISLVGDDKNMLSFTAEKKQLRLIRTLDGKDSLLKAIPINGAGKVFLRMTVTNGNLVNWSWSMNGKSFNRIDITADAAYLPPWDRALRAGLIVKNNISATKIGNVSTFDFFEMRSLSTPIK